LGAIGGILLKGGYSSLRFFRQIKGVLFPIELCRVLKIANGIVYIILPLMHQASVKVSIGIVIP
jgi:hypothetical protein